MSCRIRPVFGLMRGPDRLSDAPEHQNLRFPARDQGRNPPGNRPGASGSPESVADGVCLSSFPLSAQERAFFGVEGLATQEFLAGSRPRAAEKRRKPPVSATPYAPGTWPGCPEPAVPAGPARRPVQFGVDFPGFRPSGHAPDAWTAGSLVNRRRGPGVAIRIDRWKVG